MIKCNNCKFAMAKWLSSYNTYYCDKCVPRGCSCNNDYDEYDNIIKEDIQSPCCEFMYNKFGF